MNSRPLHFAALGLIVWLLAFGAPESRAAGTGSNELEQEGRSGGGGSSSGLNTGNFPGLGADGFGSMFKSMTDLGGFVNSFSGPKVTSGTESGDSKQQTKETGFLGVNDPIEFFKLFMNPMDLLNRIAKQFKLDKTEFTQSVSRGMNFGLETALQPPLVCTKIIEKVFVPDACKLKFICDMGRQFAMFKGQMPKFPDSFFEGASSAKAMYDGATGRECEHVYNCKEGEGPTLKKEYANLKASDSE